jgi:hypothetical protein
MAEHIALKKVLGSSDQSVGAARCAGPGDRFRPVLVGKNPRSAPHDSSTGWAFDPASSTTGESAMGASTSTTVGSPDFWLQPWKKQAVIGFHREHPLEGYRGLTFMMLDADVLAVSPSSVWRVLQAGLLSRWKGKPSRKGSGFEPPPHDHQHCPHRCFVSYINVSGTFCAAFWMAMAVRSFVGIYGNR